MTFYSFEEMTTNRIESKKFLKRNQSLEILFKHKKSQMFTPEFGSFEPFDSSSSCLSIKEIPFIYELERIVMIIERRISPLNNPNINQKKLKELAIQEK